MDQDELNNRFGFHPATDETRTKHENVRIACIELAHELNIVLPEGREKSLAMTHLQEVCMWSNAAIACNLAPLE